ncbi:MAG: HD domain-containing protein [Gemmatimonadales bacterium]
MSVAPDSVAREGGLPGWAVVGRKRLAHVERVVALVASWAEAMGVDAEERGRWLQAAWLHDALRDADLETLRRDAGPLDGPEAFWHGPAAAARAEREGVGDRGVLDAVRYHSTGWAAWDRVGRVLYCADFLEPGRSFDSEARAELARRFPGEPAAVLLEVARRRLLHTIRSGWPIPQPTSHFWNALAADGSSAFR